MHGAEKVDPEKCFSHFYDTGTQGHSMKLNVGKACAGKMEVLLHIAKLWHSNRSLEFNKAHR